MIRGTLIQMRSFLALALLLVACGNQPKAGSDANARPGVKTSGFDWSPPCRVPVTETAAIDRGNDNTRMRFVLDIQEGKDGRIEIRLRDFVFLELNGEDMTVPERKDQTGPLLAIYAALPVLRVAPDGTVRDPGVVEIDRIAKELGISAEQAENLRATYATPAGVAFGQDKLARFWHTWVGAWIDLSLEPGQSLAAGMLPRRLREAFGYDWGRREQLSYEAVLSVARLLCHRIPRRYRFIPGFHAAMARVGREPAPVAAA